MGSFDSVGSVSSGGGGGGGGVADGGGGQGGRGGGLLFGEHAHTLSILTRGGSAGGDEEEEGDDEEEEEGGGEEGGGGGGRASAAAVTREFSECGPLPLFLRVSTPSKEAQQRRRRHSSDSAQHGGGNGNGNAPRSPLASTWSLALPTAGVWVPDAEAPACHGCRLPFHAVVRRRHHCRCCGRVFCNACTPRRLPLAHLGGRYHGTAMDCSPAAGAKGGKSRVCLRCHDEIVALEQFQILRLDAEDGGLAAGAEAAGRGGGGGRAVPRAVPGRRAPSPAERGAVPGTPSSASGRSLSTDSPSPARSAVSRLLFRSSNG